MPETAAIVWAEIAGAFTVMVGIIGWLFNRGADSLKKGLEDLAAEVKGLRGDIGRYHDSEMETKGDLKAHIQKCEERHRNLAAQYSIARRGE